MHKLANGLLIITSSIEVGPEVCLIADQKGTKTMAKAGAPKPPSKSEVLANVAAATELSKKQVAAVLEAYAAEITKALGKKGSGVFSALGLVKIEKKFVPARKAEKGVPNPFKPGELMDRPAKPACNKVKVRALKLLKEAVL